MAEEFEKIEALEVGEDEEAMNTSDYAQVIFHDIAESYPVDCNIVCKYTVTSLLQATKRDWVGVYKVGWTSSKDHVYYEWAKLPESVSEGKSFWSQITFKANTLPGDDSEFYQFCYVTSAGQVRGASTPFQFKRPSVDQYVEIEDLDDDIMVIKSKTNALEDELGNVRKEKETLVKGTERLEKERESLLNKLLASEKKISSEKQQRDALLKEIKNKEAKLEAQQTEARDMGLVMDTLREKINKLSEEKMVLSRKLDEKDSYTRSLKEKVKSLINEKDSLMGKNRMLEEEKDLYKTHFSSSENTLQGHLKEIDDLNKQLKQEEEVCVDLRGQISTLGQELELTINKLNQQERTVQQEKEQIEVFTEQLKCNEEKIEALEECKAALGAELETVTLTMNDVSEKWEKSKNEAHKYKEQLKLLEHVHENQTVTTGEQIQELNLKLKQKSEENEKLTEESEKLKCDLEEMAKKASKADDASVAIMKMAHRQLTGRLNRVEQEKDELQKTVNELTKKKELWESSSQDMKREIEDLKERLAMGQDEYRDKSVECQRIRKELKKLQKRVGVRGSRQSSETSESQNDSFTQTNTSTGDKNTETDRKAEAEQTTQTHVKEEKEIETQTSVAEKENETQTSVHEKETETQTSAPEMEQSGHDAENLADLTSPELLCQLDDLGKELATRNARKQKYKELYQNEREKCVYLQKHYYEELEKKNEEIERKDQEIERKDHKLERFQQRIKFLEKCRDEKQAHSSEDRVQWPPEAHSTIYPQQSQGFSPNVAKITPILTQPYSTIPPDVKPRVKSPTIRRPNPPGTESKGQVPPEIPPRQKKPLCRVAQQTPPFPRFYDMNSHVPIIPQSESVPTHAAQNTLQITAGPAVPVLNLKELDPLTTPPPAKPETFHDHPALLPPLKPEVLPTAKVAEVLGAVAGNCITEPAAKDQEEPEIVGAGLQCPCEDLGLLNIKVPPCHDITDPTARGSAEGAAAVETVTKEMKEEDGVQASGGNVDQETEEQEEERFFDARDHKETKQCPVCDMTFDPVKYHEELFLQHIEEHFTLTKDCPMCGKKFSSDTDNQVFENHVTRHFDGVEEDSDGEGFTEV